MILSETERCYISSAVDKTKTSVILMTGDVPLCFNIF